MSTIRRSYDHLIFNMVTPYLRKTVFILRKGPGVYFYSEWLIYKRHYNKREYSWARIQFKATLCLRCCISWTITKSPTNLYDISTLPFERYVSVVILKQLIFLAYIHTYILYIQIQSVVGYIHCYVRSGQNISTHWSLDKIASILQNKFSNAFSWQSTIVFMFKFT